MLKRKTLKQTLDHVSTLGNWETNPIKEEILNDSGLPLDKRYNIAMRLVSQYMTKREFDNQLVKRMLMVEATKEQPKYAHEFLDQVLDYKLRQATKNGKQLKNDPRVKALVDISDCLTIQKEQDENIDILKSFKHKMIQKYGEYQYGQDRETILTKITYKGNICIPFDNCYVYTCIDEMGCIVDIKTNEDATYSGSIYYLGMDCICIQSKFDIVREGDTWSIRITTSKLQRPLGNPMCNVASIISLLVFGDFETYVQLFGKDANSDLKDIVPQFISSLARMLLDTLNYLGAYKSKYVYKLTCDTNTMYCYTTKIGEEVQEYMKEHYPQYTYEKLDGWIVNGYWKLLNKNDYGKDKNGVSKKGFDWVTPYDNVEKTQINSGEQQASLVPIHALQRAKERYNIDLDAHNLQEITEMCRDGKDVTKLTVRDKFGRLPKKDYKSNYTCYRLNYKNKYMDVVFEKQKENSRIMTFLPAPKEPQYPIIDSAVLNKILQDVNK